jgi:hypothetical protein
MIYQYISYHGINYIRSISHKILDAGNIGFLHESTDLESLLMEEDLSSLLFVHLNMPFMYILYWVCSSQSMGIVGGSEPA